MRMLARRLAAVAAAVVLSFSVAACSGGSTTASAPAVDVKYKCACGVEKSAAAGAAAPQCCGRPMIKK